MAVKDVKPTRSQLIEIKKRINLSKKGYKLLKMKRDGLIMEFFKMLDEAKQVRAEMGTQYDAALERVHVAQAVEGLIPVKSAAMARVKSPAVELGRKNVMGVVVPTISGDSVRTPLTERGYGIIGTSPRVDEAAKSFEGLVETIVRAAEVETSMKKLLEEVEKTKRRVNALEFKLIPELEEARDFITLRLEEMERENIFRLKRIKAKGEAEQKGQDAERAAALVGGTAG